MKIIEIKLLKCLISQQDHKWKKRVITIILLNHLIMILNLTNPDMPLLRREKSEEKNQKMKLKLKLNKNRTSIVMNKPLEI